MALTHEQHEVIGKWERRWLALSGLVSLTFVIFIAYNLAVEGAHIAQTTGRTQPEILLNAGSFANPSVSKISNDNFQVTGVAQMYSFLPSEIVVPVETNVEFFLTSRDVIHGYQIERTPVNVELVPGEVAYLNYSFHETGDYRLTCNQYCGLGHQNMLGTITVLSKEDFAAREAAENAALAEKEAAAARGELVVDVSAARGEGIYANVCAACHQTNGQGLTGAFPPQVGHTPELYNAVGGRDYLVNVVLYGLQGQIDVSGQGYNGMMVAQGQLDDEEIAAVLNYVLSAWDNDALVEDFQAYSPEDVAAQRGQGLSGTDVLEQRQALEF